MDGLRVMRADVENQHQAVPRSSGKLGLGGGATGGAAGKQQGATPLRRKALGDITNSRANGSKQNSNTPSAKQNPNKGPKLESRAASAPQPAVQPVQVEEADVATRFAVEEQYSDPAVDFGIDELLEASGPADLCGKALSIGGLKHRAVKYEEEAPILEDGESEELMDMQLDDEDEALFDMGEGLLVLGDD